MVQRRSRSYWGRRGRGNPDFRKLFCNARTLFRKLGVSFQWDSSIPDPPDGPGSTWKYSQGFVVVLPRATRFYVDIISPIVRPRGSRVVGRGPPRLERPVKLVPGRFLLHPAPVVLIQTPPGGVRVEVAAPRPRGGGGGGRGRWGGGRGRRRDRGRVGSTSVRVDWKNETEAMVEIDFLMQCFQNEEVFQ